MRHGFFLSNLGDTPGAVQLKKLLSQVGHGEKFPHKSGFKLSNYGGCGVKVAYKTVNPLVSSSNLTIHPVSVLTTSTWLRLVNTDS